MGMKLVALVFASLLAIPVAHAEDVLNPPGGPVYAERTAAQPPQRQRSRALRMALMQQFDRDGDGRLNPRERMHAARVLGRIQQKLAGKGMRQRGELRARGGVDREQRREIRRLRREQRMRGIDQREAPVDQGDAQVDIYVR
jgi:hypothetical protein